MEKNMEEDVTEQTAKVSEQIPGEIWFKEELKANNWSKKVPLDIWRKVLSFLPNENDISAVGLVNKKLRKAQLQMQGKRALFADLEIMFNQFSSSLPVSSAGINDIKAVLTNDNHTLGDMKNQVLSFLIEVEKDDDDLMTKEVKSTALVILRCLIENDVKKAYEHYQMLSEDNYMLSLKYILPWAAAFGHTSMVNDICHRLRKGMEDSTILSVEDREAIIKTYALDWACRYGRTSVVSELSSLYEGWCVLNRDKCEPKVIDSLFVTDNPNVIEILLPILVSFDNTAANKLLLEAFLRGAPRVSEYLMAKGGAEVFDFVSPTDQDNTVQDDSVLYLALSKLNGIDSIKLLKKAYCSIQKVLGDTIEHSKDGYYLIDLAVGAGMVKEVKRLVPIYHQAGINLAELINKANNCHRILLCAVFSQSAPLVQFLMDPLGLLVQKPLRPNENFEKQQRDECGFVFDRAELANVIRLIASGQPKYLMAFCKELLALDLFRLLDSDDAKSKTVFESLLYLGSNNKGRDKLPKEHYHFYIKALLSETIDRLKQVVTTVADSYLADHPVPPNDRKESQGRIWARALNEALAADTTVMGVIEILLNHLNRKKGLKKPGFTDASLDYMIMRGIEDDDVLNRFLRQLEMLCGIYKSWYKGDRMSFIDDLDENSMYDKNFVRGYMLDSGSSERKIRGSRKFEHKKLITFLSDLISELPKVLKGEDLLLASKYSEQLAQEAIDKVEQNDDDNNNNNIDFVG